ncbi:MAG TPA: DUF4919 domain-containing protein [Chryseosolibacter sp.]
MKTLLISFFLAAGAATFAQDWKFEAPNYKKIGRDIADETSSFYYPSLLARYTSGDSTLSLEERRHLYYGYTFQSAYAPYGRSEYEDSLRSVANKESLVERDYAAILIYTDRLLAYNPFDLRAINYRLFAHDKLGSRDEFAGYLTRMKIIVDAIMSSGDGKTKETAFYVISTSHEYDLINILGLQFGGKQSLIEHYDYLTLARNEPGIEGLYFDVSPCLDHLNKMFKK